MIAHHLENGIPHGDTDIIIHVCLATSSFSSFAVNLSNRSVKWSSSNCLYSFLVIKDLHMEYHPYGVEHHQPYSVVVVCHHEEHDTQCRHTIAQEQLIL